MESNKSGKLELEGIKKKKSIISKFKKVLGIKRPKDLIADVIAKSSSSSSDNIESPQKTSGQ